MGNGIGGFKGTQIVMTDLQTQVPLSPGIFLSLFQFFLEPPLLKVKTKPQRTRLISWISFLITSFLFPFLHVDSCIFL